MTEIIAATTALIAVIVGPFVSIFVARRQVHASVVSTNRQVWINNLRDTIADYLAKQALVRELNIAHHADGLSVTRIEETYRLTRKIELLINPDEQDHKKLVELIHDMTNSLNQSADIHKGFDVDTHSNQVVDLSQKIFKREWERVKSGD